MSLRIALLRVDSKIPDINYFQSLARAAGTFGTPDALSRASQRMGEYTLRITINQSQQGAVIKLEGRIAGPWVAELSRTWTEHAPELAAKKLSLDLRDITYSDAKGTQALRDIYSQTGAELVAGNPWTHFLAEEVMRGGAQISDQER